tara:strand:- start:75 stop:896 length:822 start_codon:yes stop_codon:yes gene_type:complete
MLILFFSLSFCSIDKQNKDSITVLSWNIKMFPYLYGFLENRKERSDNIIKVLIETKIYDVVIFQEAFSKGVRNKIFDLLKFKYPYQVQVDDRKSFFKINSGLWVISSIPIKLIDNINFTRLGNIDWFSSKGAQLYSVKKNNQKFYIINTHLQADYKNKYGEIRAKQYEEIKDKLIIPYDDLEIPFLLCGDLNISDPKKIQKMLKIINFSNVPLVGSIKYSFINQRPELLDYILIKKNIKFVLLEQKIINMAEKINIHPLDLSDHYPIEGIFIW